MPVATTNVIREVLEDVYKANYPSNAIETRIRGYAKVLVSRPDFYATVSLGGLGPRVAYLGRSSGVQYPDPWKRLREVEEEIQAKDHPEWGEIAL